jgi:hypothetical protein
VIREVHPEVGTVKVVGASARIVWAGLVALFLAGCTSVNAAAAVIGASAPADDTSYEGARIWVVLGLVVVFVFLGWLAGRLRRPSPPRRDAEHEPGREDG